MITALDAAGIVLGEIAAHWDRGTLTVAAVYEDATHYAVAYGNAEYIHGDDPRFMILDLPLGFVDKATAELAFGPYLRNEQRVDAMRAIHATH